MRTLIIIAFLSSSLSISFGEEFPAVFRGVYGHPRPFWDQGIRLDECGINAVFIHSGSVASDPDKLEAMKRIYLDLARREN